MEYPFSLSISVALILGGAIYATLPPASAQTRVGGAREPSATAPSDLGQGASGGARNALGDPKGNRAAIPRTPQLGVQGTPADAGQKSAMPVEDREMLRRLFQANLAEIKLAGLATALAGDLAARRYAVNMLETHGKANDELRQLAADYGVILPGGLEKEQAALLHELALATGKEFDHRYLEEAGLKSHQRAYRLFEEAGQRAKTPALEAYATGQLPVVDLHRRIAERMLADPGNALAAAEAFVSAGQSTAAGTPQPGASSNRSDRNSAAAGNSSIAGGANGRTK